MHIYQFENMVFRTEQWARRISSRPKGEMEGQMHSRIVAVQIINQIEND